MEVVEATKLFRQGHLVERPPLVYVASPRHAVWRLTRETGDGTSHEDIFELEEADRAPFGLITTQTCDINEKGPNHPWVQIALVYAMAEDQPKADMARRSGVSYLVALEPPSLEGLWVVDLRYEVPIEKGWLVGREPIESFTSEAAYALLAERLADKRDRPAAADSLIDGVYGPLRAWLAKGPGKKARDTVAEIRIRIVVGTRLYPTALNLVLIRNDKWTPSDEAVWGKYWDDARHIASTSGLELLSNEYKTYNSISAREYLDAMPVNLRYLSA
ncbi:MAG: hypothetical protein LH650_10650 [Chloroflexi bacterium]|nr:hypothetical protein [Chloroflexota bacterium]